MCGQEIVPPDIMLPEGRLEDLLEQALTQQLTSIDIRMPIQMPVSLLTDYSFSRGHIPTCTTQVSSLCPHPSPPSPRISELPSDLPSTSRVTGRNWLQPGVLELLSQALAAMTVAQPTTTVPGAVGSC